MINLIRKQINRIDVIVAPSGARFHAPNSAVVSGFTDVSFTVILENILSQFDGITFSAQIPGKYTYHFSCHVTGSALTTNQRLEVSANKNGSLINSDFERVTGGTAWARVSIGGSIDLLAGETFKFQVNSDIPSAAFSNTSISNQGYIIKVGEL